MYARLVSNLTVTQDTDKNIETIHWIELPYYCQNPNKNYEIEMVEPEIEKELIRPTNAPLGIELRI